MAIQRDRHSNSRRGVGVSFLVIFDILIGAFSFYLWSNGQISKDAVAGIIIAIVIIFFIIVAKSDRPRA